MLRQHDPLPGLEPDAVIWKQVIEFISSYSAHPHPSLPIPAGIVTAPIKDALALQL